MDRGRYVQGGVPAPSEKGNTVLKRPLERIAFNVLPLLPNSLLVSFKHFREMAFWKERHRESAGVLRNTHFEYFYTSYFGIGKEEYTGKSILDIGCGPRGSPRMGRQCERKSWLRSASGAVPKLGYRRS